MNVLFHRGEVKLAWNAEQALQISEQWQPELIFIDLASPDFDGRALGKKLHRLRMALTPLIYGFVVGTGEGATAAMLSLHQPANGFDFVFNHVPENGIIGKLIEAYIWKRFQEQG
jgi:CheY-like chemotaxis protein